MLLDTMTIVIRMERIIRGVKCKLMPLFLSKSDLNWVGWCDFETLQGVFGSTRLKLALELDKGDIVAARYETHLLETRKLIEQHCQHHLVRFFGQIGQEQDGIGWLFDECRVWNASCGHCLASSSRLLVFLFPFWLV